MAIGVMGSFVGGYVGQFLGFYRQGDSAGFVVALLGAVLVTIVYHAVSARRHVSALRLRAGAMTHTSRAVVRAVTRLARFALVGVVVSWLLYVLAANVVLSPWAMAKIFESSIEIKLDRARAWSVWPGVVHARDVRLRMQDHNIEWVLEMKSAVLTLSLVDLIAHRTIHATRVRGDGAVFRFRSRVILTETGSPTVAGYPPVPPYDDPPVAPAYVASPPIPEAQYNLWTLFIEDVDVGVREAWLHEVRYVVDSVESRARGAFRLRPAKHLWVGPASLDLAPGELTIRGERLVAGATGRVDCTVTPFDVYEPRGKEVFAFIDLPRRSSAK
jgi:hypothetical protein